MIIETLTIKQFENIEYTHVRFSQHITDLSARSDAEGIVKAIGVLLKKPSLSGPIKHLKTGRETELCGHIRINENQYCIYVQYHPSENNFVYTIEQKNLPVSSADFFDRIHACPLASGLSVFRLQKDSYYPGELHRYRYALDYYKGKEFCRLTEGISETDFFRRYLREYIRHADIRQFVPSDEVDFVLTSDGNFNITASETKISKKQQQFFAEVTAFFMLQHFWNKLQQIKNPSYSPAPLVAALPKEEFIHRENLKAVSVQNQLIIVPVP